VAAAVAALAVVVGGAGLLWLRSQLSPAGQAGEEVRITIEAGASTDEIAELLEREGVIANADVFGYYVRVRNPGTIQAGDFVLRRRDDIDRVLAVLTGGAATEPGERLTVAEGLTLPQVAEVVGRLPGRSAERFLEAARGGTVRSRYQPAGVNDLEGLVLPETYRIGERETELDILRRMVDAFDDLADELDLNGGSARLDVTPYQAVIVASLVEREAKVPQDRGPVARVVYNRLARRMPLQIDATVQFALGTNKPRLLLRDLEVDSPYNTYKIPGLPPGPIAGPGRAALEAALDPPAAAWIYYVLTDADGRHAFAETSTEFERLKAEATRKGLL